MKKLFALILTVFLTINMNIVAFADNEANDDPIHNDQATVTVKKSYKLIGAGSSPAETFTLEQIGNGVVKDGEATSAPPLGTITGAVFTEGDATSEGATKNITINLPDYSNVGIYEYTLRETAGNTAGVTYYGNDIKLVVTVIEQNGRVRVAAVHTEAEGQTKSDTFENIYSAGTLNITKTVEGILGDKTKFFEFTVTLTGMNDKNYAESYTVTGGSESNNPVTIAIGTPTTFKLKDGETISIENLPYGVTYTVVEQDYSSIGYTTTKTGDEGTINSAAQSADFTNTKGGTIDTSILLDILPYVTILALVVLAGTLWIIKRRKVER